MSGTAAVPVAPATGRVALLARRHRVAAAAARHLRGDLVRHRLRCRPAPGWRSRGRPRASRPGCCSSLPSDGGSRCWVRPSCWSSPSWCCAATRWPLAVGVSGATALCALTVRWRLYRKLGRRRPGLLDQGDVSRLMAAVTLGASVAALGTGLTAALAGRGDPLARPRSPGFGSHAASLMILLPFFVEAPAVPAARHPPRAGRAVAAHPRHHHPALPVLRRAAAGVRGDADVRLARLPRHPARGQPAARRGEHRREHPDRVPARSRLGPPVRYDLPAQLAGGFLQLFLLDCAPDAAAALGDGHPAAHRPPPGPPPSTGPWSG